MARLDKALYGLGLVKSRTACADLIVRGLVTVNGAVCRKPSFPVDESAVIEIVGEQLRYVSRGGLKLEYALDSFGLDLNKLTCLDVGASTGGFTDCMLHRGAALVYAVDVGTNQLDKKLRSDGRVISLERLDIRNADVTHIERVIDFCGIDVSFISLKLILPEIKRFLKPEGHAVALIKPQFEYGKKHKGVISDVKVQEKIARDTAKFAESLGFTVTRVLESPILGGSGNREYLMMLT